jgi:hypothetical protein
MRQLKTCRSRDCSVGRATLRGLARPVVTCVGQQDKEWQAVALAWLDLLLYCCRRYPAQLAVCL